MTQAILGNAAHPEYGVATIPFPIPRTEYANCVALLEALEIGDALDRDCQVQEISGLWPVLKRLEEQPVNLDELDYLAKRLDSFSSGELAQFQALAEKWELRDMTDLINLSFCCQEATVITDFSDLEAVGRSHYLNTHGGCAFGQELEDLDRFEFAPGVRSPEEYGRYLIRDAGHFAYDPDLDAFYDYEKYGLQQMAQEQGCFTEQGYLACQCEQSLDELLWEANESQKPAEPEMQMGG